MPRFLPTLFASRTPRPPARPAVKVDAPPTQVSAPPDTAPAYLRQYLESWMKGIFDEHPEFIRPATLRLQSGQSNGPDREWYGGVHELLRLIDKEASRRIGADWATSEARWLDYVPTTSGPARWMQYVRDLEEILEDGGSAYRVQRVPLSLQRRADPGDVQAVNGAIAAAAGGGARAAASDLAAAWAAVHQRHPNPSEAYRLAVRAVEHVTVPVTVPADKVATLGKVLNHVRDTKARWSVDVGNGLSGDVLVAMLEALWRGQEDRHGGQPDYAEVTVAQAEGAVQLATTLVRWFADGRVQKV